MSRPRSTLRRSIALALALILALTSQGFALARVQEGAAGFVVICIGGGLAAMPVGPDGRPTGPAHLCPDAVLAVGDTAVPPAVAAPVLRLAGIIAARPVAVVCPAGLRPRPAARGPPASPTSPLA